MSKSMRRDRVDFAIEQAIEAVGDAYAASWDLPGGNAITSRLHAAMCVCEDAQVKLEEFNTASALRSQDKGERG